MRNRLSFQLIVFIAIKALLNTAVRMVYPYQTQLMRGMGVDAQTFSRGIGLRYALGILGPFLAESADRRGRRFGMLFGLGLFSVGAGVVAFRPTFVSFVLALILTLLGNLVFIPSLQAYLGDRIPYERRGRALALTELGWSLSFIIGVPLVGLLIAQGGWWTPFPVLSMLGLLAFASVAWLLPRDRPPAGSTAPIWQNFRRVFTYMPAISGLAIGLALSGSNEMINLAFGRWMVDAFQVQILALGITAVVIGTSDLVGELLVAGFTDRLGKTRAITGGLMLNSLALLCLPILGRNTAGALIGLGLVYLTFEFTIVSTIPLMTEVVPASRATFMASYFASTAAGRAIGAIIAPAIYALGLSISATGGMVTIAVAAVFANLLAFACVVYIHRKLTPGTAPAAGGEG